MSEPDLYMPDSNESFDLPRWQTQVDTLSSTTQLSHAAVPYLYSGPPPQPTQASSQRMQQNVPLGQGPTRQGRISQLLEQEQQLGSAYSSGQSQLSRSNSLGGGSVTQSSSSRIRQQHHPVDDLEGAFNSDNQVMAGPRQPQQSHNSYFSSNVGFTPQSLPGTAPTNNAPSQSTFTDMYYNGSASHPPKRLQQAVQHDISGSGSRSGRSPLRLPITPISASPLDQYSHQSQYSPTTSSYQYSNTVDQRNHPVSYQSHSRNHSQVKRETLTPPISSSYSSQSSALTNSYSASPYPSSYAMDTSSPQPPLQTHLNTHSIATKPSISNPPTPMSYLSPRQGPHYYSQDQPMAVEPPEKRREPGFHRVRTIHDLQPKLDAPNTGRRMGPDGALLSPLRQLTTNILDTYRMCNPQFRYESAHNPRRVLTKPSKAKHNDGYDNEDYDYILYVNDLLGMEVDRDKYLILDILGQGTFGQVVKCQNMRTHEIVAVKVVKNKPAYFNQSMLEVTILELLNKNHDPNDEHHILRLRDSFIHRSHLCLVFELLSSNLYELIKQNQFQGLSTQLVKVFMAQLLDALTVLKDAHLIHCDLKPENILLKSLQSPQIKVIDFGSACHEMQTVYTYIQSRFYRSPEVLLGMPYTAAIDMWSLGCIAVELFLGLPLFPGTSEYNQLTRIIEMLGMPPLSMLNTGKQSGQFFDTYDIWNSHLNQSEKKYRLKSLEQYSREHSTSEQPGKQYFKATSLSEIINTAPMPASKASRPGHEVEKELNIRAAFIDFCQGLLNLNPVTRWTPQQARLHPFITGEKYVKPFVPDGLSVVTQTTPSGSGGTDPKRPYGGLLPSQPKGTRAFTDAASYNHHLAQHQAYTAQAQSQAANTFRNPYITPQSSQVSNSSYSSSSDTVVSAVAAYQQQQPAQAAAAPQQHSQYLANQPPAPHRGLTHQTSTGQLGTNSNTQFGSHTGTGLGSSHLPTNNVSTTQFIANSRARANTINQREAVPPALARLQHMNQDIIGGRNALTPVLNRDDAMREWERRQAGKAAAAQPYPQLEFLQQQAEIAATSGLPSWSGAPTRYPPPPSKLSMTYQPTIMIDDDSNNGNNRRDAAMSNVRTVARNDPPNSVYNSSNVISSPPQAYTSTTTTTGNRFPATFTQNQPVTAFDSRNDMGNMYVPMQPDQYQAYSGPPPSSRHVTAPAQAVPPSFYGPAVPSSQLNSTQARNPFQLADGTQKSAASSKDTRRGNGVVDTWQR